MELVTDGLERVAGGVKVGGSLDVRGGECALVSGLPETGAVQVVVHGAAVEVVRLGERGDAQPRLVVSQQPGDFVRLQPMLGLLGRWAERWSSSSALELGVEVQEAPQLRRELG